MKEGAVDSKKIVKIVLWSILGVILLFVLIVIAVLLVEKYIKKSAVPMFAGYGSMIVITGSMSGTIEKGDLIIVKKTNDYELGDIVTYVEAEGKTPVTHRLVNKGPEEGTFIAKGDANNTTDIFPISVDMIAGEVVGVIPKVGLVFEWFLYEQGFIYVGAIAIIIAAAIYFWNLTKPKNGDDNDEDSDSSDDSDKQIETLETAEPQKSIEAGEQS